LLAEHRALFGCDFIVLCDTPNFARGVPAITYRLRGNCIVDVEVRCLERPLHSGQGGGIVPDAIMILCTILGRLWRDDGTLAIPGLYERVTIDDAQLAALRALPFDRDRVRRDFGLLDGVPLLAESWETVWTRPSLTITRLKPFRSRRPRTRSPMPRVRACRCAPCAISILEKPASCLRVRFSRTFPAVLTST
jgi:hypothetical protein